MTATVARLHAGDGYTYLTRQVATGDLKRERGQELSDYYNAAGAPPGRWHGRGMAELEVAGVVTEAQMKALFGEGLHPDADERITAALSAGASVDEALREAQLGRRFPRFDDSRQTEWGDTLRRAEARVRAFHGLDDAAEMTREHRREARHSAGRELFVEEFGRAPADAGELEKYVAKWARPTPQPVSGYDVTFTPVKSVSVLWGLADDDTRRTIEAAHSAAVDRALTYIEDEAAFTRAGVAGIQQHETTGIVAVRFDHFDSRTGDPNLHTHVAIANRVQGTDGKWRTLDGRLIFAANVSYSEVYNTALEDEVSHRLGVTFENRQVDGKRPVREIAGVDHDVMKHFSQRRAAIEAAYREAVREYRATHGHEPDKAAQLELAQKANLDTRAAKGPMESLADKRDRWRAEAIEATSADRIDDMLATAQTRALGRESHALIDGSGTFVGVDIAAAATLDRVTEDRATWRRWHVYAEAQRQLRGLPGLDTQQRQDLAEQVTDHAVGTLSVLCEAPDSEPIAAELTRGNGEHVYRVHGSEVFTSERILAAERALVDAANRPALAPVTEGSIAAALEHAATAGIRLDAGQLDLVRAFAGADRQLIVGLGAAGTGKTRAMGVVVDAAHRDGRRVIGLAPSAAAAKVFASETGADRSETIDKILFHLAHDGAASTGIDAGDLVVVDEAGMAGTAALATLLEHCEERGARIRLLGDDQQLGAVAAGGALRTIAHEAGAVRLTSLHRFNDPAEAAATLQLRAGDQAAVGFYQDAARIVEGSRDQLVNDLFEAWQRDRDAGKTSLMIAGDRETVRELSERARAAGVARGDVEEDGIVLHTGSTAGRGDVVVTRRNDRRLAVGRTDFVKNGDLWKVTGRGGDGSLTVQHAGHGGKITLPADYVSRHVELGYSTTVHRSQGMTVDVSRVIVEDTMSREQLYVAMTRGRGLNTAYTITEQSPDLHGHAHESHTTGREVLAAVMARTDESARSAHEALRESFERSESLSRLIPEYEDALTIAHDQHVRQVLDDVLVDHGIDVDQLREDPAYPALSRRLASRVHHGRDVAGELHQAIEVRELATADSIPKVLAHRLDRLGRVDVASDAAVPDHVSPALTEWLEQRQQRIENRKDDLVQAAADDPPSWLRNLRFGGRVVDDAALRRIVIYRDRHGVTDTVRPVGIEPEYGTARHEEWTVLMGDLRDVDASRPAPAPAGAASLLERARRRPGPGERPTPGAPDVAPQPDRGRDLDR